MNLKPRFTRNEEIANTISHGLAALFALTGLVLLIVSANKYGTARHIVSFTIFGSTMTLLYLSSTLNHGLQPGRAKDFFHNFDQIAIFLLIAGTYTPLSIVALHDDWGWTMFSLQWGFAASGIIAKLFLPNRFEKGVNIFFVLSYIIMGWMLLFFLLPIFRNINIAAIIWIFAGGVCYTLGTVFFKLEKMPFAHLIWHLFVVAGSVFHWIAIFGYLLPNTPA